MESSPPTEFSIRPTTEQLPFQDKVTQRFFSKWCEVNDSIAPYYLSRQEWDERKKKGILQKRSGGKAGLFVPEDLKLWEMVDVIEAVDSDTFAYDPYKKPDKRRELSDLGDLFVNTGIYLTQNLDRISAGRQIAVETAKDFYRYGNALRTGNYEEQTSVDEIADNTLSDKQKKEIDAWFGVDKLVVLKKQDAEQARGKMLAQFFKVTEKAKESETHRKAVEKVHKKYLEEPITKPKQELESAIFRRGLETLVSEMGKEGWRDAVIENFKEIGIDLEGQRKNLREVLEIPRLKQELADLRTTDDIAAISEKEREIAFKIQKAVVEIPFYPVLGSFPSEIVKKQYIDCVGGSMLGGALFKEAGINYLVGYSLGHSQAFLITSDERVYLQDFTSSRGESAYEIKNQVIRPFKKGNNPISTKDIVNYSHDQMGEVGLSFVVDDFNHSMRVIAYPPETGTKIQVITNAAVALFDSGEYAAAIGLMNRALLLDERNYMTYINLCAFYVKSGNLEKGLEAINRSIKFNPEHQRSYEYRSKLLKALGRESLS